MTKYYVEFEHMSDEESYCLQSKWFDTKEDAINWYRTSFDFVRTDDIIVSVMKAEFDDNGMCGDIEFDEDITTQYYLRSDNLWIIKT